MPNPSEIPEDTADTPEADATPDVETGADTPEPTGQDADIAAFSKGMEEAEPEPAGADAEADDDPPQTGSEAQGREEAAKAADKDKPEPDAAVEDEIKSLNLKEQSAARFRELANHAKEYEPVKAILDKAGVTPELLPQLVQHAQNHAEWTQIITESTAKPEQLTSALHLIQAINSDDPETLTAAYGALEGELAMIGKRIGRAAPGYDPLAEHADLTDAIEAGDMTRKHALEVVQSRASKAQQATRKQEAAKQGEQQAQAQQAQTAAVAEVQTLNARLKSEDPAHFAARVAQIDFAAIKQHPPHLWPAKIEAAYWRAQVAAAKPAVGNVPLRPTGNRAMQRQPKNEMEAFEMGVSAAR